MSPYLTLTTEDAPQHDHRLREVCNGLRWIVRAGAVWRLMPHDLAPWHTVYQQSQRWHKAGVFAASVHALHALLRLAPGRHEQPLAALFESRTRQSTPDSGTRAGSDGAKCRWGSTGHLAGDTPWPTALRRIHDAIQQASHVARTPPERAGCSADAAHPDQPAVAGQG